MNEHEPHNELLARLQLLVVAAKMKLAGAELSELVLVTLEQSISARELNLSRQGYNRALDALEDRMLLSLDGKKPQLHPEACAKFGITRIENDVASIDLLLKLADGTLGTSSSRKNLYQCNADGLPASEDEQTILFENLKDATVHIASWLGRVSQEEVLRAWIFTQGASREMHMRGMASIVQGYLDGRLYRAWPGALGKALTLAIRSVRPEYPTVLDPHRVLDRFRTKLRNDHDKRAADLSAASQLKAILSKQANAVPRNGEGATSNRPPTA